MYRKPENSNGSNQLVVISNWKKKYFVILYHLFNYLFFLFQNTMIILYVLCFDFQTNIVDEIPLIFDSVFECTLEMINKVITSKATILWCGLFIYHSFFLSAEEQFWNKVSLLGFWRISWASNKLFSAATSSESALLPRY